jgi:hypothetical protein
MNPAIFSHIQKIDILFGKISSISDPKDQSEWSKYLCVLVSGFIEESVRVLLEQHCKACAALKIQNFVISKLGDLTNCKTNKINSVLCQFSPDWAREFMEGIGEKSRVADEIKNSVDSVIANRHQIAHGKSVGMTYATISKHYKSVKIAIKVLEDVIR